MSKWVDYKPGDYEKKFYDIKTMAGHTYYGCWPNAGFFHPDGVNKYISEDLVTEFKEVEDPFMREVAKRGDKS